MQATSHENSRKQTGSGHLQSVAVLAALLLAACGGGGGGSAGPTSPPPPPPPPSPTQFGTLEMTEDNAAVVPLSVAFAEGVLALAQTAANEVIVFASPSGATNRQCEFDGTASITFTDADTSFSLSAGDTLNIDYDACYGDEVDGEMSGTMTIVISAFDASDTSASVRASLEFSPSFFIADRVDPSIVVGVEAGMEIEFSIDPSEFLAVRNRGSDQITLTIEGVMESATNFQFTRDAQTSVPGPNTAEVDIDLGFSFLYDSTVLGGTATCQVDPTFSFMQGNIGFAGVLCRGRNGSGLQSAGTNQISVDPEGDGQFTLFATIEWFQVFDGFIREASGLILADLFSNIGTSLIPLGITDIFEDVTRSRILVTTKSGSANSPNALVALSLAQGSQNVIETFATEPSSVAVSADGAFLYIGFTDQDEIRRYDADTMQLLATMQITSDDIASDEYGVLDIAVSPIAPRTIAVSFWYIGTGVQDAAVFVDDAQLPGRARNTAGSPESGEQVVFSEDGQRIHSISRLGAPNTRPTGLALGPTGITEAFDQRGFGSSSDLLDGSVYSNGTEHDAETFVNLGTFGSGARNSAIDAVNRRYYGESFNSFEVWDLDRHLPIATYDLGFEDNDVSRMEAVGDFIVFVTDDDLRVLDTASIEALPAEGCLAVANQSIEGADYTQFACDAIDSIYDGGTDRIYIAVTDDVPVNGNSIAVIDPNTNLVETYIPVPPNPKRLALSANGARLYVIFAAAELLVAIDTATRSVVDSWQLGIVTQQAGFNTNEPRRALQMAAASTEPDTVVILQSEEVNTLDKEFVAFRDGSRLVDEVPVSELKENTSFPYARILFDAVGTPYALHSDAVTPYFQTLMLTPTGIASTAVWFDATGAEWFPFETSVDGSDVYFASGDVVSIANQTVDPRFDANDFPFSEINGASGVYSSPGNDDVWFVTLASFQSSGLARFDNTSGSITGSLELLVRPWGRNGDFSHVSIFDVGADRLGMLIDEREGVFVVEKSQLQ